jgi:hypothetical protein
MTSPRSKTETLSETTKTYLKEWLTSEIYGVQKNIQSKYLTKGVMLENEAIDRVVEWLDMPLMLKNEKHFEDNNFQGTPDLFLNDDTVIDIKCSWDCFTFPLFETEIPTTDYYYQMQVYMLLTGRTKAKLIYVLLNTPDGLSYDETFDYSNIDKKYRIKVFDIDFEHDIIEALIIRVKESRKYIKTLLNG